MKLYSHPLSLFSAKVRIALAEKGLAYELENVPLDRARGYEPKHPQVVAHNPKQQVPVFVDGDFVLYDSTVILEFLEDMAPEPALYPREPKQRARCRLIELEADELFFAPIAWLIHDRYARALGAPVDAALRARAEAAFAKHSQRFSAHLGASDFLCERFSVADISAFLVACYGQSFDMHWPGSLANLHGWFARVADRACIARELAGMLVAWQQLESSAPVALPLEVSP